MALTLKTLQNLEGLLTSDHINYKGSEILAVFDILSELRKERADAVKTMRIVPMPDFSREDQGS